MKETDVFNRIVGGMQLFLKGAKLGLFFFGLREKPTKGSAEVSTSRS